MNECPKRPIVYLTKAITFSAAHRLHSHKLDDNTNQLIFGKCNHINGHGHNYKAEICLKGPIDEDTGMLINLVLLKKIIEEVIATLDHRFIDKDCEYFLTNQKVSTVENIAIFIFNSIKSKLPNQDLLYSVKVHETDSNLVEYRGEYLQD